MTTTYDAIPANPFTTADGATILACIDKGRRGNNTPLFAAACDEVDRRVTNRIASGKALTQPIVAALAILDRRGIAHAGPKAKDAPVLTHREKVAPAETVTVPDTITSLPVEVVVAPAKAPKAKKGGRKADPVKAAARKAAEDIATFLTETGDTGGKGWLSLKITAEQALKADPSLLSV